MPGRCRSATDETPDHGVTPPPPRPAPYQVRHARLRTAPPLQRAIPLSHAPAPAPPPRLPVAQLRRALAEGTLDDAALHALADDERAGARQLHQRVCRARAAAAAEARRLGGMLRHERLLWRAGAAFVAGVDEVGVGPLAGPVVAGAVVFDPLRPPYIPGLNDSKQVPRARHAALAAQVWAQAEAVGIGEATAREIDALGLYVATRLAAVRAVAALGRQPDHLLLDAHPLPAVRCPQTPLVHGDALSQSIAAASLVAKVHRDAWMHHLDGLHPGYGFAAHVGYGTAAHLAALARLGPSPAHRLSFGPVRAVEGMHRARAGGG